MQNQSLAGRLTRLVAGLFGGEANELSPREAVELEPLIASMSSPNDEDVQLLIDAWEREDADARTRAWADAQVALKRRRLDRTLDDFRQAVGQWAMPRATDFQGVEGLLARADLSATDRQIAARAILDKAVSILGRDGLTQDDVLVLSRPWDSIGSATPR